MKSFSAAVLAKMTQQYGSAPVLLLRIQWSTGAVYYSDRAYPGVLPLVSGVSELGQQQQAENVSEISAINVSLVDDGSLIGYYRTQDFPRIIVDALQWYSDIPLADASLIFRGRITGGVKWDETERVLNLVAESISTNATITLQRTAYDDIIPLVFGNVKHVPAVKVVDPCVGTLYNSITQLDDSFAIADCTYSGPCQILIDGAKYRIAYTGSIAGGVFTATSKNDVLYRNVALHISAAGYTNVLDSAVANMQKMFCMAPAQSQALNGLTSVNYCTDHKYKYYSEAGQTPTIKALLKFESIWAYDSPQLDKISNVYALTNPTQVVVIAEVAGAPKYSWGSYHQALKWNFDPSQTVKDTYRQINLSTYKEHAPEIWAIEAGARVYVQGLAETYQATNLPHTIVGAAAYRSIYGRRFLADIPSRYFTISGQTLQLVRPLNSYIGENWEDQIYLCVRTGNRNTVDQVQYLIQTYTDLGIDAASFADVRTRVAGYPSSFILSEESDVYTVCKDIARQAKCALILRSGVVSIVYLPYLPAARPSLGDQNVLEKSLSLTFRDYGSVYTRVVATWRPDLANEPEELVLTKNTGYGLINHEELVYIYNQAENVRSSMDFWLTRNAFMWRQASFQTTLALLNLESFDPVTFYSRHLASVPGVVDAFSQAIDNWDVAIDLTLACKAGETVYDSAFFTALPGDTSDVTDACRFVDYVPDREYDDESLEGDVKQRLDYSLKWNKEQDPPDEPSEDEDGEIVELVIPDRVVDGEYFELQWILKNQDGTPYHPLPDRLKEVFSTYADTSLTILDWWNVNASGVGRAMIRLINTSPADLPRTFQIYVPTSTGRALSNSATLNPGTYRLDGEVRLNNAYLLPTGAWLVKENEQHQLYVSIYQNNQLLTMFDGTLTVTYPADVTGGTQPLNFLAGSAQDYFTYTGTPLSEPRAITYTAKNRLGEVVATGEVNIVTVDVSGEMVFEITPQNVREGQQMTASLVVNTTQELTNLTFTLSTPDHPADTLTVTSITVVKDTTRPVGVYYYTGSVATAIAEDKIEPDTTVKDIYLDPVPAEFPEVNTTKLVKEVMYSEALIPVEIVCSGTIRGLPAQRSFTIYLEAIAPGTPEVKKETILLISRCDMESTTSFQGETQFTPGVNETGYNGKDIT